MRSGLLVLFLSAAAAAQVAAPLDAAAKAQLPLSCRVTFDQGWGEIQIRNEGAVAIPKGSTIAWQTSSGRAGSFVLSVIVAPGHIKTDSASFQRDYAVDDGATCTASVASHPPILSDVATRIDPGISTVLQGPAASGAVQCKHCDQLSVEAPSPVPQTQAMASAPAGPQRFEDPVGPSGLRLYACTSVGGRDCGRTIAQAFCQQQGYAQSADFDVDNKKTRAETLAGEVCTKKKCKVFEFITCSN
jgi:hypothetical protein